jgi:ABC-type transport system involved in multi-copper enzyme maturation permease subunit
MPILTIAALTLREAVRRRVVAIVGTLSLALIVLIGWGIWRLDAAVHVRQASVAIDAAFTVLLAFMFSVVLAIGSAFLAAGSIAGDVENGIVLAILPRPISRAQYVLGKWVGLVALVSLYALVFGSLGLLAIALGGNYEPPHPAAALAYLVAQSIALLSLGLLLSTRVPALAGGVLAVALFGASWIAGITAGIARAMHAQTLQDVASFVGLLVPTDGLWRGAVYELTPVALLVGQAAVPNSSVNPFGVTAPPPQAFVAWSFVWIAGVLAAALRRMSVRDI